MGNQFLLDALWGLSNDICKKYIFFLFLRLSCIIHFSVQGKVIRFLLCFPKFHFSAALFLSSHFCHITYFLIKWSLQYSFLGMKSTHTLSQNRFIQCPYEIMPYFFNFCVYYFAQRLVEVDYRVRNLTVYLVQTCHFWVWYCSFIPARLCSVTYIYDAFGRTWNKGLLMNIERIVCLAVKYYIMYCHKGISREMSIKSRTVMPCWCSVILPWISVVMIPGHSQPITTVASVSAPMIIQNAMQHK